MGLVGVTSKANNDRAWRGCAIEAESKGDKQRRLMLARSSLRSSCDLALGVSCQMSDEEAVHCSSALKPNSR